MPRLARVKLECIRVRKNQEETKEPRTKITYKCTSKGVDDHLGLHTWANILASTKLQNLITFLVEGRRPRDPLENANAQDATLGILREKEESSHNSKV